MFRLRQSNADCDILVVDEVGQGRASVPCRVARRVLVHVLVEQLHSVTGQDSLVDRVSRRKVLVIDRVFRETACLERFFRKRKILSEEGRPAEELSCIIGRGPARDARAAAIVIRLVPNYKRFDLAA